MNNLYGDLNMATQIQFDIFDNKGRRLGLEISKSQITVNNEYNGFWMTSLHQTRNGKTYGGSSTWDTLPTEQEADDFIAKNIPLIEKKYAKKWETK